MIKNCSYILGVSLAAYGFSNKTDIILLDGLAFLKPDKKSRV
jgi:hypothetical protein